MTLPAQWSATVLARRRAGPYVVLTVAARGVADRCRAGHFASVSVAGEDSAMLLRRQIWIANSSASGRDGGALELVIDPAEPGGRRVAATEPGAAIDVMAPLGRPFSLPREQVGVLMVACGGVATAPLIRLATDLGARGSRVTFLAHAEPEPFGMLDAKRVSTTAAVTDTELASAVAAHLGPDISVLYSAGPAHDVAAVARAAEGAVAHQAALQTQLVCSAGTCTSCVVPVTGRDRVTRMVRACTEGPVFNADLVRWDDLGLIPPDCTDVPEVLT